MKYEEGTEYVLTATRCRPSWREQVGNAFITQTKRFKRGDVIRGIPQDQVARLVEMGHAVPEADWDPAEFRKASAARRLTMQQAAAADDASKVAAIRAAAERANGQPVAGLPDADKRTVDGIEVDDVVDLDENGKPKQSPEDPGPSAEDDDAEVGSVQQDYESMPYPELVRTAKDKTGNGGGTKEELIARLREHDAQQ